MKMLSKLKGMGKAIKRFADGGEVTEGQNAGIGDDTRARALAWAAKMAEGGGEESPAAEPVKAAEPAPVRKKVGSAPVRKAADLTAEDDTKRLAARAPKPMSSYDRMNAANRADDRAAASKRNSDRAILRDNVRKGNVGEVDSKTLLPVKRANGGLVKLGGVKSHGKAC